MPLSGTQLPAKSAVWLCLLALLCAAQTRPAPRDEKPDDVERLVREGQLEALDRKFAGGKNAEQWQALARAAGMKAARQRETQSRRSAFDEAERRYQRWIDGVGSLADDKERRLVALAEARSAYAEMILSQWLAQELDEFELYDGNRSDVRYILTQLHKARTAFEQSRKDLDPLHNDLERGGAASEERLLTLGVLESLQKLRLDVRFLLAWTHYHIAHVDPKNVEQRSASLATAEKLFSELASAADTPETTARCTLGLALVLRGQRKYTQAQAEFAKALKAAEATPMEAQVRYEQARGELAAAKFDDARKTLEPLLSKDIDNLSPADQQVRFYIHLAHLYDAASYLTEAQATEDSAATSSAREAQMKKAARTRETGMARMSRLAGRGGPWPSVVQAFVVARIKPDADPKTLSSGELLFAARALLEQKKHRQAFGRLSEAAARPEPAPELAAEILYEIGVCEFQGRRNREAATAFATLASRHKSHPKAEQAATHAFQLWAGVADDSKKPEDFLRLAEALLNLVQNFPRHEKREEALWWLPVAYQSAGKFDEAMRHYAAVPVASVRWEEAQFRRAICRRQAFEAARGAAGAASADAVITELTTYARDALTRAAKSRDAAAVRRWSATALATAAETLIESAADRGGDALALLTDFETRYPESDVIGRVLAVRIRAYRSLRRLDEAAKVVEQFLKTVPGEQAGGVLTTVARGMLEEIERLEKEGSTDAARKLATDCLPTFDELDRWVRADAGRAAHVDAVTYQLARLRFLAGQLELAAAALAPLRTREPANGVYQRLHAAILSAALTGDASPPRLATAREAWSALLADAGLRSASPEVFWEARFEFLSLLEREGRGDEVRKAIEQEAVWTPELGGPRWKRRFEQLLSRVSASAPALQP
jgi:outer membrane protein assembly factor BamD (BamD/ComL family)